MKFCRQEMRKTTFLPKILEKVRLRISLRNMRCRLYPCDIWVDSQTRSHPPHRTFRSHVSRISRNFSVVLITRGNMCLVEVWILNGITYEWGGAPLWLSSSSSYWPISMFSVNYFYQWDLVIWKIKWMYGRIRWVFDGTDEYPYTLVSSHLRRKNILLRKWKWTKTYS